MELILRAENALNLDRQEDSLEYLVQHDARCGCVRNTALGSLCGAIDLANCPGVPPGAQCKAVDNPTGEEWRAAPGQKLKLCVTDRTGRATGLHVTGSSVSPSGALLQQLGPGTTAGSPNSISFEDVPRAVLP